MRARELPADDQQCGWCASLEPTSAPRRLEGNGRADCAVIGAGFTGLAIARQLAAHRPDWRIVLLEAQRVGLGASGRNSGFVVDVGHADPRRGGANQARCRLGRAGLAELRSLVERHAIACQWSETGKLHAAVGPVGMRALEVFLRALDAMGEPYETLDADAIAALTGSRRYRAGARTPGGATIQPAALVRGLAAHLAGNVELFEESPVRSIGATAAFTIETGGGTLRADRVFLATNGYTPALGFLANAIFPLFTFASLTRPLDEAEQAALGGAREWALVCEDPMGTTVRRTADQRILIRNSVRYTGGIRADDRHLERVRAAHLSALRLRFPTLERLSLESTWGGVLGITMNATPYFGEIAPGIFAAAGYNGVGVALGTIAGGLLADLAVGATSGLLDDMRSLAKPAWLPPRVLLGPVVRPMLALRQARAREEL